MPCLHTQCRNTINITLTPAVKRRHGNFETHIHVLTP